MNHAISSSSSSSALSEDVHQLQWQHHPSIPLSQSTASGGGSPTFDLRFSWSGADMEPWRCRRTDGKKWRCSRDVAPHQKYCDRHTHKNRPRSRKPVELSSQQQQPFLPNSQIHSYNISTLTNNPYDQSRFLPVSQQQWKQPSGHASPRLESKGTGHLGDIFLCPGPQPAPGLPNLDNDPRHHYDHDNDVISSASSLKHPMDIGHKGLRPVSSLITLSIPDDVDNNEDDYKFEIGMNYPWMSPSNPGGPLGEALCMSVTRGDSNSKYI